MLDYILQHTYNKVKQKKMLLNSIKSEILIMDIEYYKNFHILAQSKNFSEAARELNIAQTALGAQINKLEKYYGVKLLQRKKGIKHISLTNAGVEFLHKAERLCSLDEEIKRDMQKYSGAVTGTLRIAVSHTRSNYFLEKYVTPFFRLHPEITYEYYGMVTTDQVENMRSGNIDFAFANAAIPAYPEFSLLNLEEEQFYAFYRQDLRLWESEPYIGIEKLQGLPLCSNTLQFPLLKRICDENFIKLNVNFMTNTLNNAYTLISNTDNIAVLAAMTDDKVPNGLMRKLIKDARLIFHQVFYWNKARPMSLPAQTFLEFFEQQLKKD